MGYIKWRKTNTSTMTHGWAKVNTCSLADEFCKDGNNNTETWYCRKTWPARLASICAYNCKDHYCTVGDCNWHWERSDADDSCIVDTMTYDGTNLSKPECTVTAVCLNDNQETATVSITARMHYMDDLEYCNGQLQTTSC